MQPVVTPAEMGEADRYTISSGTPEEVLVERAGRAVARHALRLLGGTYGRRVVVVRVFIKKTQKAPERELRLARERAKGVT